MTDIDVHTTLIGGGFGRKYEGDYGLDAALLANAVPGRPVKVVWTREDDFHNGKYRPLEAQFVEVDINNQNEIAGWRHHIVADSIMARYAPSIFEQSKGIDIPVVEGIEANYDIINMSAVYTRVDTGVEVGFWRSVGPGYTKLAVEGMLDEVAAEIKADPLEFRLNLLKQEPRAQAVLNTVAEMSGWRDREYRSGMGIAYSDAFGSHCAQVAKIEFDPNTLEIRVTNVWCAFDPGIAMQPINIESQIMGGIIFGMSHVLNESITFADGAVQEANFNDYPVLRMSQAPSIEMRIITSPGSKPGGVGEAGVPPIGPAIANAFASLTGGARLRHYPFTSKQILQAQRAISR